MNFTDITTTTLHNLIITGISLIPLMSMRVADIFLGVSLAKKQEISLNRNKFLWGLFHSFCFLLGVAFFVLSVSMISPIAEYFNVTEEIMSELNDISTVSICVIIIAVTITSYGKDCFDKIKLLIKGEKSEG